MFCSNVGHFGNKASGLWPIAQGPPLIAFILIKDGTVAAHHICHHSGFVPSAFGLRETQTSKLNGLYCIFLKFDILIKAFFYFLVN